MTTDQKIDEILRIVQEHDQRFLQIDSKFESMDARFDQVLKIIQEMDDRFSLRFLQVDAQINQLGAQLHAKIDSVHSSLFQDIQAFAGDLYKFEKRLPRPKKKSLS